MNDPSPDRVAGSHALADSDASVSPGPSGSPGPLRVDALSHGFQGRRVLDDISLDLAPGQVMALLGPNGAGKTTLVRLIAGRLSPVSGSVIVCGHDPYREQAARGRIGLVPQHLALYDTLTARENLEIFGQLFGLKASVARQRAGELLALTGLSDRAGTRVGRLSGGMRRRLNIVAAVMHRPALLLLDEPSVGVDIKALDGVIDLIGTLKREGYAILLTTHDMGFAEAVCDQVAILRDGALVATDTLASLKARLFGDARLLTVTLGEPTVDAAALEALSRHGLSASPLPGMGAIVWQGRVPGTGDAVSALMQERALPSLRQVTLTDPGLADIYKVLSEMPENQRAREDRKDAP